MFIYLFIYLLVYLTTLAIAEVSWRWIAGRLVNNELGRI
jgi:hypothetical protein